MTRFQISEAFIVVTPMLIFEKYVSQEFVAREKGETFFQGLDS